MFPSNSIIVRCTKTNIHNIEKPYRLASHMTIVIVVRCCYQRFLILVIGETAWFVFSFRMFPRILVELFFFPWFLYSTPSTRNVIYVIAKNLNHLCATFSSDSNISSQHRGMWLHTCSMFHQSRAPVTKQKTNCSFTVFALCRKKNCFIKSLDLNSNSCLSFERKTSTKWRANKNDNHDDIPFLALFHLDVSSHAFVSKCEQRAWA